MTMQHLTITEIQTPAGSTFANAYRRVTHYFSHRAEEARLAKEVEALQALDSHMLSDIGLKGFQQLPIEEQKRVLVEAIMQS